MKHPEWLWATALLALLFVGYGLIPAPRGNDSADSFDEDGGGKKAFFLLAQNLLSAVERNATSLVPDDPDSDTLVILGPARYPDRAQWQTLHDWVSQGRVLVFAARWRDPAVELEPFGVRIVPTTSLSIDLDDEEPEAAGEEREDPVDSREIETDLVEGIVDWRSFGQIRYTEPDATVVLYQDGAPQILWQAVGDGSIIVVASDFVFTNRSLTKPDSGLLAFRVLELAEPSGPVYFDESMNAEGAPKVVGILMEDPFRLLTLQLLVVTLLFGWMVSRRFGPLQTSSAAARRSLVEHAQALGSPAFPRGDRWTSRRFVPRVLSAPAGAPIWEERERGAPRGEGCRAPARARAGAESRQESRDRTRGGGLHHRIARQISIRHSLKEGRDGAIGKSTHRSSAPESCGGFVRGHAQGSREGHHWPGGAHRRRARRAFLGGQRFARGPSGTREDASGERSIQKRVLPLPTNPVHSGPHALGPYRSQRLRHEGTGVSLQTRAGVHQSPAYGRDQPLAPRRHSRPSWR